jgi:hypothetical protein
MMTFLLGVLAAFGVPLLIALVVGLFSTKDPPEILAEFEAMEAAARIRSMSNEAQDRMDVFIRERQRAAAGEPADELADEWERPW